MQYPARDDFYALAAQYSVVPIWRRLLADQITPVAAFARVVGDEPGFLLESVEHGERWSRWSFVGRNPTATIVSRGGRLDIEGELPAGAVTDRGVLQLVESLLAVYRSPSHPELPPLHGGLIGYLGYDVVREVERLSDVPPDDLGYPDAVLSVIGQLAVFDHWRQQVSLIENVLVPEGADHETLDRLYDEAVARLDQLAADGAVPLDEPLVDPPDPDDPLPDVRMSLSKEEYCTAVEAAREYVYAGDVFQVVLSKRFDFELDADPFDVYRVLRQINPSPYMYFLRNPATSTIVGCVAGADGAAARRTGWSPVRSPVRVSRGAHRGGGPPASAAELTRTSRRKIAEHVMLVDLARNDVGRVVRVRHRCGSTR